MKTTTQQQRATVVRATVVMTTINSPRTEILRRWRSVGQVIVVGDAKTPHTAWNKCANVSQFISNEYTRGTEPLDRRYLPGILGARGTVLYYLLPQNSYSRKMLGYIAAMRLRPDTTHIVDTDDDNIPTPTFYMPPFQGKFFSVAHSSTPWTNIHAVTAEPGATWPRGFPLSKIVGSKCEIDYIGRNVKIGVWQGLVDGDPDVDAIHRLTGQTVKFRPTVPVVIAPGSVCPFNSQNTVWDARLLPLMYLPTEVEFRYADILRSVVAQPIMRGLGLALGFYGPTAIQTRNEHKLMDDFADELSMYTTVEEAYEACTEACASAKNAVDALRRSYAALENRSIITSIGMEHEQLECWLSAVPSKMLKELRDRPWKTHAPRRA